MMPVFVLLLITIKEHTTINGRNSML